MEVEFVPRPQSEWRDNLDDTFGIFKNSERFEVILQFTPERSRWIREQLWHPSQKMEELEGGSVKLSLMASHYAEILMEILAHGSHVEVLEPSWLRERVVAEGRGLMSLYRQ